MRVDELLGPDLYDRDCEVDDILFEMSNVQSKVTGLPQNIQVWIRTDLSDHGHNRYRVKIRKNKQWAGVYLVNDNPSLAAPGHVELSSSEDKEVKTFIKTFTSLIISLIDEKISTGEFEYEVVKIRGQS